MLSKTINKPETKNPLKFEIRSLKEIQEEKRKRANDLDELAKEKGADKGPEMEIKDIDIPKRQKIKEIKMEKKEEKKEERNEEKKEEKKVIIKKVVEPVVPISNKIILDDIDEQLAELDSLLED